MIKPSTRVFRKQIIDGVSIPAIIHNLQYHFVDLDVYEDGRVECWDFEDFDHFKKKVKSGWVVLNIPEGQQISIHGLGTWAIDHGNWTFSSKSFIDYVLSLIREMNPGLTNMYKYTPKKVNGVRIRESGRGTIYKEYKANDPFAKKIDAEGLNLFYKSGDEYWLVKVNAFADTSICLSRLESPIEIDFPQLEKFIADGIILTDLPADSKVNIYGLGSFNARGVYYNASIGDKLSEIRDLQRKSRGEPSSLDICREAYGKYLQNPTLAQKEILKISYENVPKHQRMYVGDMDTKDIQVRMIIYGEQEIEPQA